MKPTLGQDAAARFTPAAMDALRNAIDDAGGREVFFAGVLGEEGRIEGVRVCARGHESAVPATFENLKTREIVIHNHPNGDLEPSNADLDLAAMYSHNGHGVYIVDNDIARVYVVVEPFDDDRHLLDPHALAEAIRPDSSIARRIPQFEVRPQQIEMMEAVCNAFNDDGIAVIEAPTGVGKTLAYLLPAVTWALRNRERVVISTRTINLQEQIVLKDIPVLQACLDEPFSTVLVKGRQNYVCRLRLERALTEATLFDDEEDLDSLKAIEEWAAHTADGSKSDLSFVPSREVWERVCSDLYTCTAAQCHAAGNCFITRARREIAKADIVVVNHHMLFSDLAIKRDVGSFSSLAVLPAFYRVILDEAHHIEDAATHYLGSEATRNGAMNLFGRFARLERERERGLLPFIKLHIIQGASGLGREDSDKVLDLIDNSLVPALLAAREAVEVAFKTLRHYVAEKCGEVGRDIKWRLTDEILADPGLREVHTVFVVPAADELTALAAHCTALLDELKSIPMQIHTSEKPLAVEAAQLQGYRDQLLRLATAMTEGTNPTLAPNTVRWVEIDGKNENIVRVASGPIEVGEPLSEWVYPYLKSIVMTSATLTVQQSFEFLSKRIGLDRVKERFVTEKILDSPFDFRSQAILCIPNDTLPPDDSRFLEDSTRILGRVLHLTKGRAFILFTSFYALKYAHDRLEEDLKNEGITPLRHGSMARTKLLDAFRSDVDSVLFATDSFWEGVDVAGDALQCVVLPKLPFRVPTEPVLQARAEAIENAGGNAFMDYVVPLAVIKFRQGFGRLIRRRTDRGSIVVLDSRVLTKRYGRIFLNSLPGVRIVQGPQDSVLEALELFHAELEDSRH